MALSDPARNPYLTYILTGNYGEALPHYLQPENYRRIQANIDGLTLRQGAIDAVAAEAGAGAFDGYNLSDIFEYLAPEACETVYRRLLDAARPQARFAYWNMLVPRTVPAALAERVQPCAEEAERLFARDRAFFYARFIVEEVR